MTKTGKEIAGEMRDRIKELEAEKCRLLAAAWFLDPVGRMPVEVAKSTKKPRSLPRKGGEAS